MPSTAHDLFLLMSSLSQLKSRKQVERVFIEAINSLHPGFSIAHRDERPAGQALEIQAGKNHFGYLEFTGSPETVSPEFYGLLQNAVQMLALILENLANENLLEYANRALNELIQERTLKLQESEKLLRSIAANYPHSYISIIEKDLTMGFTSGQEFSKLGLDPENFIGQTLEQVFGELTPLVKENYLKTFDGEEIEFELFINNQYQLYRTVPLYDENQQVNRILTVVENITPRKHTEQTLRDNQSVLRTVVDAVTESVFMMTMDGTVLLANLTAASRLGTTVEKMVGNNAFELLPPETARVRRAHVLQVIQSGNPTHFEDGRNGSWFENSIYPIPDQKGEVTRLVIFGRDITQHKKVVETLRRSNAILNSTQRITRLGGWEYDVELKTMFWTDETYRIHGFQPDEIAPGATQHIQRSLECYDPQDRPVILAAFQRCIDEGQAYELDMPFTTVDGRRLWIRTSAESVREGGKIVRVIGTIRDITDRKLAEEALRQSEEQYRLLANNSPLGILINRGGKISYINPAAMKILGAFQPEDILGKSPYDIFHPDDHVAIRGRIEQLLEKKHTGQLVEEKVVRLDGEVRVVEVAASPITDLDGYAIQVILNDITDRKQMQEMVIASEKMAGLGTLSAGIAHEINTPLQIITGTSEILIDQIREGNPPDTERLLRKLQNVNHSAWRVAEIVRSLLAYAHPASQKFSDQDFNALIRDTLLLIEHQLKSWNNVFIKTYLAQGLPVLYCDRNQISQSLINLLTNARDAMPGGGEITIRTFMDSEKHRIALQVSDQGCGIMPEVRGRIFDPFFTTKPVGQGTGLGLSIISGMVRLHKGEIEVDTHAGKGTIFTLWFPVQTPIASPEI